MAVEFHVRGHFSRLRLKRFDDLQGLLVDNVHLVSVGAEEHICPGVTGIFVTAHEKTGTFGFQSLDHFPGVHVDNGDGAGPEVGSGHDPAALILPGNAGSEVRHARQR